ncbi:hypothetical protein [Caulobacter henricii]|uniref:hypothetical protein n=1 Tax=Caulobacter henricii TaxID=69395 RepID=UPI001F1A2A20|nr:hypothetical protein [Caulobacter henricii]
MTEQIGRQAARQSLAQKMLLGSSIVGAVVGASTVLLGELGISLPPALILGGGACGRRGLALGVCHLLAEHR